MPKICDVAAVSLVPVAGLIALSWMETRCLGNLGFWAPPSLALPSIAGVGSKRLSSACSGCANLVVRSPQGPLCPVFVCYCGSVPLYHAILWSKHIWKAMGCTAGASR